ncbi:MAG: hypothetical protein JSV24_11240, partial [Bacteroidales bacterium]
INTTGLVRINFNTPSQYEKLNQDLEVTIYRIVKELINNTLKHASADRIDINFRSEEKAVMLNYCDNGVGFDVEHALQKRKHKGMGLSNIISRVRAANGRCLITSNKSEGTRVEIEFTTE